MSRTAVLKIGYVLVTGGLTAAGLYLLWANVISTGVFGVILLLLFLTGLSQASSTATFIVAFGSSLPVSPNNPWFVQVDSSNRFANVRGRREGCGCVGLFTRETSRRWR
jgi:hypothetical protein